MSRDTEDKLQDLTTYGVSFSKGGKRIDPRDVYISTEPEQEPVAWMLIDKETGARIPKAYKPEHGVNKDRWELYPLHTTLPKREPLSDEAICDILIKKEWKGFVELVRIIEKAHGIGEG